MAKSLLPPYHYGATLIILLASLVQNTHAILDSCDYLKWHLCSTDFDCAWDQWKDSTYDGVNGVPLWHLENAYGNFASYSCASPEVSYNMTNCPSLRCIPSLISGYACQTDGDCYDGQVCQQNLCVACNGGGTGAALYFSDGACHQVATPGSYGYDEGESGCAGDHCLHSCAYDTQCVRILANTTTVNVIAPHNQLPAVLTLDDQATRDELMRSSTCGGTDAGEAGSGMRCARTIHRAITSLERTPDEIRDRNLDVVELSVMKYGGDDVWENYVIFDDDDVANRALELNQPGERGYSIGYVVSDTTDGAGSTLGQGVFAYQPWGRTVESWERRALIQCDVKYSNNAPLHMTDDGETRSTLVTRVCVRFEDKQSLELNPLHSWDDPETNSTLYFIEDDGTICGPWGTISTTGNTFRFKAKCTLSGPTVTGIIPTAQERDTIETGIRAALTSGAIQIHDVLRASFHDAAAFTPDPSAIFGGARGCMRYEHVHGNAPNLGLAFLFEPAFWNAIGCRPGKDYDGNIGQGHQECWSMADILVFAGAVASEWAQGPPGLVQSVKWGRVDAPRIFCTGELQTTFPDANGGHKEGSMRYGSSNVEARLQTVFDSTKSYFEQQLGLASADWVAYLAGGHSVGGVKGLIQAKNTRLNFDATPSLLDNLYLHRVARASDTSLMSLCPQSQRLGSSHFWEPTDDQVYSGESINDYDVLIDTDVSLTMNDDIMEIVKMLAHDQGKFFDHYTNAFLHVSELGYDSESQLSLIQDGTTPAPATRETPAPTSSPSFSPSVSPSESPVAQTLSAVVCGGSNACRNDAMMVDPRESHEVRCCSDAVKEGWAKNNNCDVWAASKVPSCFHGEDLASAEEICRLEDARLCTAEEIYNQCTKGSGCGHDSDLIWSSFSITVEPPPVAPAHFIACGASNKPCAGTTEIALNEEYHDVRCCSDTFIEAWNKRSGCDIWSDSEVPTCFHKETFVVAKSICAASGARLCTTAELLSDCSRGTGCSHDNDMLWSSTPV